MSTDDEWCRSLTNSWSDRLLLTGKRIIMSTNRVDALMQRFYGKQINGTIEFRDLIAARLRSTDFVLDLGCGPGRPETDFRGKCAFVAGCDFCESVAGNRFISAGLRGDAYQLPFRAETFDVIVMDFVLEHLKFPDNCARELFRVLKPGGSLFFRTPNFYHYVAIISYLTPHWVHRAVVHKLSGSEESDPFETHYRANTRSAVKRVFSRAQFEAREIRMVEKEPYYLTFAAPAFLAGYCYERLVNKFDALATFRSNIFGNFAKTA